MASLNPLIMLLNFSRKGLAIAVALTGLVGMVGCAAQSPSATSTTSSPSTDTAEATLPQVVATHTVLCDLTRQIAADTVNLQCLIPPGTDVHVYQPTPEASRAIESANLILYGGYGFEPSLIRLIEATSNSAPKVAVSEIAVPNPLMGEDHHEHGEVAHEEEAHEAETPDPHVWQNAQNGVQIAEVIREQLTELQPDRADLYAENAETLTAELEQIDAWVKSQIATIPESTRKLVTTHDALGYYAQAYSIPVEGALLGISTEEAPTATRVKELVEEIEATQVPTIFAEANVNPKLIETVAKEADVKLSAQTLYADSLGEAGSEGDSYQKMLIVNTETIVQGLGGKFTPF